MKASTCLKWVVWALIPQFSQTAQNCVGRVLWWKCSIEKNERNDFWHLKMMSSWQMTPKILERRTICTCCGVILRWLPTRRTSRGTVTNAVFFRQERYDEFTEVFYLGSVFFKFGGWFFCFVLILWNYMYFIYIHTYIYMMDDIWWDRMGRIRVYICMICMITQVDKMRNHHICRADRMFYGELMMDGTWLSSMDDLWIQYDLWKENSLSLFFRSYKYVVVSDSFYFLPDLGKMSNLTHIFQMGWNHQPDNDRDIHQNNAGGSAVNDQVMSDCGKWNHLDSTEKSQCITSTIDGPWQIKWWTLNKVIVLFNGSRWAYTPGI